MNCTVSVSHVVEAVFGLTLRYIGFSEAVFQVTYIQVTQSRIMGVACTLLRKKHDSNIYSKTPL